MASDYSWLKNLDLTTDFESLQAKVNAQLGFSIPKTAKELQADFKTFDIALIKQTLKAQSDAVQSPQKPLTFSRVVPLSGSKKSEGVVIGGMRKGEKKEIEKTSAQGSKTILKRDYEGVAKQVLKQADKLWADIKDELKTQDQGKITTEFAKRMSLIFEQAGSPLVDLIKDKNAKEVMELLFKNPKIEVALRQMGGSVPEVRSLLILHFQSLAEEVYKKQNSFEREALKATKDNPQNFDQVYFDLINTYLNERGTSIREVNKLGDVRAIFEKSEKLKPLLSQSRAYGDVANVWLERKEELYSGAVGMMVHDHHPELQEAEWNALYEKEWPMVEEMRKQRVPMEFEKLSPEMVDYLKEFAKLAALIFENHGSPLEDLAQDKNADQIIDSLFKNRELEFVVRLLAKENPGLQKLILSHVQKVVSDIYKDKDLFEKEAERIAQSGNQSFEQAYALIVQNYLNNQGSSLEEVGHYPELRAIFEKDERLKNLLPKTV